jgi:hypothetical protein
MMNRIFGTLVVLVIAIFDTARAQDGVQIVGQSPADVTSADPLPGVQDGGVEIQVQAGGTIVRQPDQPDDPRDTPVGDDPRDEPLPDDVCGPDITATYVEALNRAFERLQQLSDAEKGLYDGVGFLDKNGGDIDLKPRPLSLDGEGAGDRCPRGRCLEVRGEDGIMRRRSTVTLAGHCLPEHISNDILYGFVAYMIDVPYAVAWLGAQAHQRLSYGGWDPQTSNAAYTVGWGMARSMSGGESMTAESFQRILETEKLGEAKRLPYTPFAYDVDLLGLLDIVHRDASYVLDCAPCPEPCTSGVLKDWTLSSWTLNDGRQQLYDP